MTLTVGSQLCPEMTMQAKLLCLLYCECQPNDSYWLEIMYMPCTVACCTFIYSIFTQRKENSVFFGMFFYWTIRLHELNGIVFSLICFMVIWNWHPLTWLIILCQCFLSYLSVYKRIFLCNFFNKSFIFL